MKSTVSKKSAAKIGLMGSISVIIASVVGVGIFFKNGGVFKNNDWNCWGVLLSWIIATVIALATAFSYAEIVTVKGLRNPNAGLAGWSTQLTGRNFGRGVSLVQTVFYYSPKVVSMGMCTAVAILQTIYAPLGHDKFDASYLGIGSQWTGAITCAIAFGLITLFMLLNYLSSKFNQTYAKVATISKFLPILLIIGIGLVCGILAGQNLWNGWQYTGDALNPYIEQSNLFSDISMAGVLKSIPAILFAYDSFLVIGNVSNRVQNPEENVPKAIVLAMIITAIAQVLITIAEITIGTGSPYLVLHAAVGNMTAGNWAYITLVVILSISIVISACGVLNGLSGSGINATQVLVDERMIFGYQWVKKIPHKNPKLPGFVMFAFWLLFLWVVVSIPTILLNTSQIYDGFSTLAVLFFFGIYGTVILSGLINRKTQRREINRVSYFVPVGIIAVIGCYFLFAYCIFYQFGGLVISNPTGYTANSFGFAMVKEGFDNGKGFVNWQAALIFWSAALFFVGYSFLNDLLIKLFDKNNPNPLIWEKKPAYDFWYETAVKLPLKRYDNNVDEKIQLSEEQSFSSNCFRRNEPSNRWVQKDELEKAK